MNVFQDHDYVLILSYDQGPQNPHFTPFVDTVYNINYQLKLVHCDLTNAVINKIWLKRVGRLTIYFKSILYFSIENCKYKTIV